MVSQQLWVHGHSTRVEYEDRMKSSRILGSSIQLTGKPSTDNWVHLALPTLVIEASVRKKLDKIYFRYRCRGLARISHVHAWDGDSRVLNLDSVNLTSGDWTMAAYPVPGSPHVQWGVGLSLGVHYTDDPNGRIELASAGCDLT